MRTFNNIYSLNLICFIIDQISEAVAAAQRVRTQPKKKLVSVQGIPAESGFRGLCGRSRVHTRQRTLRHTVVVNPHIRVRIQHIWNGWRPAAAAPHSGLKSQDHLLYFPTEYYDYDLYSLYTIICLSRLEAEVVCELESESNSSDICAKIRPVRFCEKGSSPKSSVLSMPSAQYGVPFPDRF